MKLFGSEYEELGSLDKNLVLNTAGKVKFRYGGKFVDLDLELLEKLPKIIEKLKSMGIINNTNSNSTNSN